MADTHINFRIGSVFTGEGFKRAMQTVGSVNRVVGAGKQAFMALTEALGENSGAVGKAANAMSGLISAFAAGGVQGIAFAGTLQLINWAFEDTQRKAKAAAAAAAEFRDEMARAVTTALAEKVKSTTDEINALTREFDRITRQANAFTAAMNGLNSSKGGVAIANLEVEKYNAVMAAVDEAEKAHVSATYDLKIAKERERQTLEKSAAEVETASRQRADSEARLAVVAEQYRKAVTARAELEEIRATSNGHQAEFDAEIAKLKERESQILAEYNEQLARLKVAGVNEAKAREDAAAADSRAALETRKAADAVEKVRETGERLVAEQQARLQREREAKEAAEKERDLRNQAAELQRDANEASRDVAEAERAYAEALANYEENFAKNKINEFVSDRGWQGGRRFTAGEVGALTRDIADHELQKKIAENGFKNVAEAERFRRDLERQTQQQVLQREKETANDEARAARLEKMNPKALSKADRDWLEMYRQIKDAAERDKQEVQRRERELKAAREREIQLAKDVGEINSKLQALGLK